MSDDNPDKKLVWTAETIAPLAAAFGEPYPEEATAFARIEVSEDMIDAGQEMLARYGIEASDEVVVNVFRTMRFAECGGEEML